MKPVVKLSFMGLLASLAFLSGCTTYDTIDLDPGTKGYRIYCSGLPYAITEDCFSRARDICEDKGYTLLSEHDATSAHNQMFWDNSTHDILIKCNTLSGATPDAGQAVTPVNPMSMPAEP